MPVNNPAPPASTVAPEGTVLVAGASIEQNEGDASPIGGTPPALTYANGLGPVQWANAFSGGKLRMVKNVGLGLPSTTLLSRYTNPNDALYALGVTPAPGIIYLGHVTGDDPTIVTPALSAQNDLAIYNAFRGAYPRALIVLPTLPGVNLGGGNWATRATVNPQRRKIAQANPNTILFNFEGLFTDPATGFALGTLSQDGVHPNPNGGMTLGQALNTLLGPYLPGDDLLVNDYLNDTRVIAASGGIAGQAMMNGAPGVNTTATGWSVTLPVGATRNLIARTDQYGNWQELVYGGTAGSIQLFRATAAFPTGTILQAECQVQFQGNLPYNAGAGISDFALQLSTSLAGASNSGALGNGLGNQGGFRDPGAGVTITLRTPPIRMPSPNTGGFIVFGLNQGGGGSAVAGSVRVGRYSLIVNPPV